VQKDGRALDVPQELQPEPDAEVRPLDDPRDVRDDQPLLVVPADDDHAEVRPQRRERVRRDPRPRARDRANERRLADVRIADEPDGGEQLELEPYATLLPRLARLELRRRAVGRRREVDVAAAAPPALRDDRALAVGRQIRDDLA